MIIRENFLLNLHKTYAVTPHQFYQNCLIEMVQMRGHNIWFQ